MYPMFWLLDSMFWLSLWVLLLAMMEVEGMPTPMLISNYLETLQKDLRLHKKLLQDGRDVVVNLRVFSLF